MSNKVCNTCPHAYAMLTETWSSVKFLGDPEYKGIELEIGTANHCHEDTSKICRGSVISLQNRARGCRQNNDTVYFKWNGEIMPWQLVLKTFADAATPQQIEKHLALMEKCNADKRHIQYLRGLLDVKIKASELSASSNAGS